VIAQLGDGYFLVELFEWFAGSATTQHILHIGALASKLPDGGPRYRFFENMEDAGRYMDIYTSRRDEDIRELVGGRRTSV